MNKTDLIVFDRRGSAAAELALSLPLLLLILFGAVEMGMFFYSEHKLVESVRDAARFASRQSFVDFPCDGTSTVPPDPTRSSIVNVLRTGRASGGTDRLPLMNGGTYTVEYACVSQVETLKDAGSFVPVEGIYASMSNAPVVTVDASVPYQSVFGTILEINATLVDLNAHQQATVNGI